jgi:K(+)-stimulated pyrophosphate-energized sodium pump
VKSITTKNGEGITTYENFEGSEAEVKKTLEALHIDDENIVLKLTKDINKIEEDVLN